VLFVCWCVVGVLLVCWCVVDVLLWCVVGVLLVFGVNLQLPQCVVALLGLFTSATMRCGNYSTSRTGCGRTSLPQPVLCISGCLQNVFWALKTLNEQIRSFLLTYILTSISAWDNAELGARIAEMIFSTHSDLGCLPYYLFITPLIP